MECLRTAVRFRPPPPIGGPRKTNEGRNSEINQGFRPSSCPRSPTAAFCNPPVADGGFDGNCYFAPATTANGNRPIISIFTAKLLRSEFAAQRETLGEPRPTYVDAVHAASLCGEPFLRRIVQIPNFVDLCCSFAKEAKPTFLLSHSDASHFAADLFGFK